MKAKNKDLWVFIETEKGRARNVGLELLNPGRKLADRQGGKLVAVIIGTDVDEAIKDSEAYGADHIIVVDAPEFAHYTTDAYVDAFTTLVNEDLPTSILIGATNIGRDMAPRLACRLKTGLTADCTGLSIDEESSCILWTRPAFGGNLMASRRAANGFS